jgi:hypothetical protein
LSERRIRSMLGFMEALEGTADDWEDAAAPDPWHGVTAAATVVVCRECGRQWSHSRERWRAHLTDGGQVVLYCPECANAEFGEGDV